MSPPKTIEHVLALPIFDPDKFKKAQRHAVGVASIRALQGLRKRTPVATGQTRGRVGFRISTETTRESRRGSTSERNRTS